MFIHAKKLSITAVLALLGSAMIASPALGAPKPPPPGSVSVDCSIDGDFTYREYDPGTGVIVEIQSGQGCQGTAIIPANVTSIASNAFMMNSTLTSVEFQAGSALTIIGSGAFMSNFNLTSITIPSSVTTIRGSAFFGTGLTSVTFDGDAPAVVEGIGPGRGAFMSVGLNPVGNIGAFADGFGDDPTWNGLTLVRAAAAPAPTPTPEPAPAPAPAPAPYSGPIPTNYSDATPAIGDEVTITGVRLDRAISCTIDGVEVEMSSQSVDSFSIVIPEGLEPGIKDLVIFRNNGQITAQGAFTVEAKPIESPTVAEKTNAGSFNGYVAVYAKGHKGKTLSWRIAGKWFKSTITSDFQVFQRKTEAVGLDVEVHLYINGQKQATMTIRTR
jgi:hypothetical protein